MGRMPLFVVVVAGVVWLVAACGQRVAGEPTPAPAVAEPEPVADPVREPAGAPAPAEPATGPARSASGPPGAPLHSACGAIGQQTRAVFAKLAGARAAGKLLAPRREDETELTVPRDGLGECVTAPNAPGAWALAVHAGGVVDHEGVPIDALAVELVLVSADGARRGLKLEAPEDMPEGWNVSPDLRWEIVQAFDWTGDGVPEVALRRVARGPDYEAAWIELFRATAAGVEPWRPQGSWLIDAVTDGDGDGRPDLMVSGPFERVIEVGMDGSAAPEGLHYVYASRPGGGFDPGGDEAKAYYRKACGGRVEVGDIPSSADATTEQVLAKATCARLYGAPLAAIRARVDPWLVKTRELEEIEDPGAWLVKPPVKLE